MEGLPEKGAWAIPCGEELAGGIGGVHFAKQLSHLRKGKISVGEGGGERLLFYAIPGHVHYYSVEGGSPFQGRGGPPPTHTIFSRRKERGSF